MGKFKVNWRIHRMEFNAGNLEIIMDDSFMGGRIMNTPLEVMRAIVENGGPIEAWVSQNGENWNQVKITGADLGTRLPFCTLRDIHKFASITDPNKIYQPLGPWVNNWAKWRAVDHDGSLWEYSDKPIKTYDWWTCDCPTKGKLISKGHDPTNWENSLEERKRPTRPMTPREFAKFVGENMGKYLYRAVWWNSDDWTSNVVLDPNMDPTDWLYAENVPGDLEWRELPQTEVEG